MKADTEPLKALSQITQTVKQVMVNIKPITFVSGVYLNNQPWQTHRKCTFHQMYVNLTMQISH